MLCLISKQRSNIVYFLIHINPTVKGKLNTTQLYLITLIINIYLDAYGICMPDLLLLVVSSFSLTLLYYTNLLMITPSKIHPLYLQLFEIKVFYLKTLNNSRVLYVAETISNHETCKTIQKKL